MHLFYNIYSIILHIIHTICVTIKLYMAQFYEVEWCRKRMQIELREKKVKIQRTFIEILKLKIETHADGTWPNRLMLSYFSHESSMTLVIKLEILLTSSNFSLIAWSIGHGLYFCFKHQLKYSTYTLIISFPFFSININSFLFKVNNLFIY